MNTVESTTAPPRPVSPESIPTGAFATPSEPAPRDWSLIKRLGFRFVCVYFFLYSFPFPIGVLPFTESISGEYDKLWFRIVPWIGEHVLHLNREISVVFNGSGDTTFNYVQNLCLFALALLATLVWSFFSKSREHTKLDRALRVYVRYVLAFAMLSYGMSKVFKSQFPSPTPGRLLQTYGDSSPMGLLWTFMGYSTPYTIFAGAAEVFGGVLLLFRRTTTLGALVLLAVIGNIVALNFCYDVPVKLYSVHLWLMSAFLVLPDIRRLGCILLFQRATTPPVDVSPLNPRRRRVRWAAKALFVGLMVYTTTKGGYDGWKTWGDGAARDPLDGAYNVEDFTRNGKSLPAALSEPGRWRRISINTKGRLNVRRMDDSTQRYRLVHDSGGRKFLLSEDTSARKDSLTYTHSDATHLELAGVFLGDSLRVRLTKMSNSDFPLMNRGFHWINEAPFNR